MADRRDHVRHWTALDVPVLVVCWLVGYLAPWLPHGSGTAWLTLSAWGAHSLHGLEASSKTVTIAVTFCAVLGAILRLISIAGQQSRLAARQLGLFATCVPLCVVMPSWGAAFFVTALFIVTATGWALGSSPMREQPLPQRLLRESFAVLAAVCFLTMSWQYNAQWLMRGLLIAAGTALLARAALPLRRSAGAT
jgi:hypothetical protein